mmetsp:Transcript_4512/g.14589  ORF Transcript_4512/g.14589 Transcript_4512/m.14589 type:complete len:205 (+) Transcript_4512:1100-1714(+)
MAALTELSASSYRSFLSLSSVSVAAPTLMRPMAPPSLATRSSAFSLSNCESVSSASARITLMRSATSSWKSPVAIIVVRSLATAMRCALPSISGVTPSRLRPSCSVTKVAPVTTAMSSRYARRLSPKPGGLMAHTSSTPRILLSTSEESASPVTSSAMMRSGSLEATRPSRRGTSSCMLLILRSVMRTRGFSSSQSCDSWSLTK